MNRLSFVSVLWVLVSACSLTGEPQYFRPLPSSDVTESDGAKSGDGSLDGDGSSEPDGVGPDVVSVDGGPACVARSPVELCNGLDDDCNDLIDDVLPPGTLVPCIVGTRSGRSNGCACVPTAEPEICFNGLDDNGDGQIDEGCACEAYVVPNGLLVAQPAVAISNTLGVTRPVFSTIAGAIAAVLRMGRTPTVCLVSSVGPACTNTAMHTESFEIPAGVSVVGGFTVTISGTSIAAVPSTSVACRSRINGTATFPATSTPNSVLARVKLSGEGGAIGVHMEGSGWFVDSDIELRAVSAGGAIRGVQGNGVGIRVLKSLLVRLNGTSDATAVDFSGGSVVTHDVRVEVLGSANASGIHLVNTALAVLENTRIEALNANETATAIHVDHPAGRTFVSGLTGSAGVVRKGFGLLFDDSAATLATRARVSGVAWQGSDASDEAIGALVHGMQVEFVPTSSGALVDISAKRGEAALEDGDALRCEWGAVCVVAAPPGEQRHVFRTSALGPGNAGTITNARGVAVLMDSTAQMRGATIIAADALNLSVGIELAGRLLDASHLDVTSGNAPRGRHSIAVELTSGRLAALSTSVVRARFGTGVTIALPTMTAVRLTSNTITHVTTAVTSPALVDLLGATASRSIHFENNFLVCSTETTRGGGGIVMGDHPSPFSRFAYNLFAACSPELTIGAQSEILGPQIQSRLDMGAVGMANGEALVTDVAAVDSTDGWRLQPSSPAQRAGSSIVNGTVDFNGQRRPGPAMNPMPDIGADEI